MTAKGSALLHEVAKRILARYLERTGAVNVSVANALRDEALGRGWITAEELRAGEPDIAGAFFSDSTVEFETTNIYIRGSIIAGKMDMGKSNAYLVTNPLLPEYLPDSLPGAEGGLLMPGMWTRN